MLNAHHRFISGLVVFWIAAVAFCCPLTPIRFELSALEYLRCETFFFLPVIFVVFIAFEVKGGLRVPLVILTGMFSAISLTLGGLLGAWFSSMMFSDEVCKTVNTFRVGDRQIEVCRTNLQGGLGPYDIEIRQVWILFPGIKRIEGLWYVYGQSSLTVSVDGRNKFSFILEPRDGIRSKRSVVTYEFRDK